jgi:D-arabinose 1-dehydrogenase-like Zn-dependent alcohol dehydrogenase
MGFHTVAIARGRAKEALARKLGAHRYIDSEAEDAAKVLAKLGCAKVVLATVTSGKAMTPLIDGLAIDGMLIVLGASTEPIEVNPLDRDLSARQGAGGL